MYGTTRFKMIECGLAAMFIVAGLLAPVSGIAKPPRFHAVPRAVCGPEDRIESGLQGQTTIAERFRPGPGKAYNCNLDLIGQFEGEGAGFIMQIHENCAYFATWPNSHVQRPGVTVLDISDIAHPRATDHVDTPVMRDAGESLTVASPTNLLLGSKYTFTPEPPFEIYGLFSDCRRPVLKSRLSLPGKPLHAGQFAADGRTFYGAMGSSDPKATVSGLFVLDAGDPSNPRMIAEWIPPKKEWVTHAVSLNKEGTRAYVALLRFQDDPEKVPLVNGLAILDSSDIQARRENPQFRLISTHFWDDTHYAQFLSLLKVRGRPYLAFSDLAGAVGNKRPPPEDVCRSGRPGHGFARMIDISNERQPRTVGKLMLEIDEPDNCEKVMHDPTGMGYGNIGCDVDDPENARLLACAYIEAGLRVFDVRDPAHPREVAYYKPPARRTESRPASLLRPAIAVNKDLTADQVVVARFLKGGRGIALLSFDNGFQVVQFRESFKQAHPELFATATQ